MEKVRKLVGAVGMSGYRRASQDSHFESLLNESQSTDSAIEEEKGSLVPGTVKASRTPWLKYSFLTLLFIVYSLLLITFGPNNCSDQACGEKVSVWSPMNEAIEYVEFDFSNDFDHDTQYRGPPSPELEQAWNKLWMSDPVPFPEDKLDLVNRSGGVLDGSKLARLDDGKGAVAANFEMFHQLHCLNYLRQYTWRDWYFRHPDKVVIPQDLLTSDVGARMHADHCIDVLRTSLMCYGDTTPFFTVVDPSAPLGARGDFRAHHKCRKFDKLHAWMEENGNKSPTFEHGH